MPIVLGTDRVSPSQREYLQLVRRGGPPGMLREFLTRIARDDEILSGDEELHPEWLPLYQRVKRQLRREMPSRALQQLDEFFASAQPYDPDIVEIDPTCESISFLLGAGASKPKPSGIPTVKELLPDLLTRARRLDREEVTRLAAFCDDSGIDNIEDLLTAAQISEFCSRNPSILRLVDFLIFREETFEEVAPFHRPKRARIDVSSVAFLQDTLQVLFGLLSSRMLPADPNSGHNAIVEYVRSHSNTPIVTTNYDCCIDRALTSSAVPFSYLIEFANPKLLPIVSENATPLIKLHGSLNWFYCETCQEVHLIDIEQTVADYQEDRASYPVIGVCRNCGGQRRGLLVPPLAMKFDVAPPLNPLIDRAAASFAQSSLVVVVGFSFADADLYISRMLSKAMQASENTRLIVFDPDYDVVEKVRRKFSVRIPKFDASRILWIRGDCAEMLPKFLAGELLKPKKTKKETVEGVPTTES
ncbi:MAG: SIR2 family NAD-dependent protein deacylase [Myxococcota bacterium]